MLDSWIIAALHRKIVFAVPITIDLLCLWHR